MAAGVVRVIGRARTGGVRILDIGQAVIHDALALGMLVELTDEMKSSTLLTDLLLEAMDAAAESPRERFDLLLAQGTLWRMRGDAPREQGSYEQALRLAAAADGPLLLGIVYGALGKFHEPRDLDRAFACYQDSVECLRRSGLGVGVGLASGRVVRPDAGSVARRIARGLCDVKKIPGGACGAAKANGRTA